MSTPPNSDPRFDQSAQSDEALVSQHDKLLEPQPDDKGHYKLLPLNLLFVFSGLIFFAGTYLGHYSGYFDAKIYNEHQLPGNSTAAAAPAANPVEVGKKIYATTCASCHQVTGLGAPGAIPPLAASDWVTGSEQRLIRAVVYGLQGPIKVNGIEYNSAMQPNGRVAGSGFNLGDDKIAAVLTYIRQEWGNQAGPISTEAVAAVRAKEGDRKPYVPAEIADLP